MITTAITSFGMSGLVFHGPSLRVDSRFRVKSILERSKEISKTMFPGAVIVRSYDEILRDPEIELVIVNTPDSLHFEMAKAALEAGKHVVVEKPFTLRSSDADQLIALANKKQRLLTAYQNRRWDGDFLTVKNIIDSGALGQLVEFESHFDRYRRIINTSTWKEEAGEYAGVLYNLGSHMADQALVLFGMPEAVTAHLDVIRPGSQVVDYYDLRLHYPGVKVLLRCSYLVLEEGPRYILHGTEGSFLKWGIDPQEDDLKKGILPGTNGWGEEPADMYGTLRIMVNGEDKKEKIPTLPGNYMAFYDNLYRTIRHGEPLAVQPQEARNVIRVLEAALESNKSRRTVTL